MRLKKRRKIRVLIAGGGTGGHLFPGIAVAEEFRSRNAGTEVLFIVGRRKMETNILHHLGFPQTSINIEGLKGRGWRKGIMTLLRLPLSLLQAISAIRKFAPHAVLGVGGYASGPVCLAAKILRIPAGIHEQNTFPGLTNRLLCRVVDKVFIAFEKSRAHFSAGNILLTGNPIRKELLILPETVTQDKTFTILVVGGSQGARSINKAVVEALFTLKSRGIKPEVIHQTGENDYARVTDEYRRINLKAEIVPFIHNMAQAYHKSDLAICRAGALTVSELAALGKPSILIPYPFAANRHQEMNAIMLTEVGGAEIIDQAHLDGSLLADAILRYIDDPGSLHKMGEQARSIARTNAAEIIADELGSMAKQDSRPCPMTP
ncbi:undecaprenyldiphospho-muramoylpentapeptide beta-N-acetylglucosaminyltransferase [Thermodesulfobacteriota bacterium]